jgi:hypothetical protein
MPCLLIKLKMTFWGILNWSSNHKHNFGSKVFVGHVGCGRRDFTIADQTHNHRSVS